MALSSKSLVSVIILLQALGRSFCIAATSPIQDHRYLRYDDWTYETDDGGRGSRSSSSAAAPTIGGIIGCLLFALLFAVLYAKFVKKEKINAEWFRNLANGSQRQSATQSN